MNAEFFRQLAQQCRMLMERTRTDAVKLQLRMWVEEFEAQAEAVECEDERHRYNRR
jgi:hypothetical protein